MLEETGKTLPWRLQGAHSPAHTLISDFPAPDCERINCCCSEAPSLWHYHSRPGRVIQ